MLNGFAGLPQGLGDSLACLWLQILGSCCRCLVGTIISPLVLVSGLNVAICPWDRWDVGAIMVTPSLMMPTPVR